jgi:arginine decarboxylase
VAEPLDHVRRPFGGDARSSARSTERRQLLIRISSGTGVAVTQLAAFDNALLTAGVGNYNLVRLSSVIPPHAVVREVPATEQLRGTVGDVAYCVYAAAYADTPGEQAWAGVAWALSTNHSGSGLFVEHTASSESMVHRDLDATIDAMSRTRGSRYRMAGRTVSSAVCVDRPVCALVIATYGTSSWSDLIRPEA